jgi:hypothetical protein
VPSNTVHHAPRHATMVRQARAGGSGGLGAPAGQARGRRRRNVSLRCAPGLRYQQHARSACRAHGSHPACHCRSQAGRQAGRGAAARTPAGWAAGDGTQQSTPGQFQRRRCVPPPSPRPASCCAWRHTAACHSGSPPPQRASLAAGTTCGGQQRPDRHTKSQQSAPHTPASSPPGLACPHSGAGSQPGTPPSPPPSPRVPRASSAAQRPPPPERAPTQR